MGSATDPGRSYGNVAGFVFVFNLVVGIGGLALPLSFSHAGMVLGMPAVTAVQLTCGCLSLGHSVHQVHCFSA